MHAGTIAKQIAVLEELVRGGTSKDIAKRVRLAPGTVDHYVAALMERFGVNRRADLKPGAAGFLAVLRDEQGAPRRGDAVQLPQPKPEAAPPGVDDPPAARARITLTPAQLREALGVPEDVAIVGSHWDFARKTIVVWVG